jgi:hypothetical protein
MAGNDCTGNSKVQGNEPLSIIMPLSLSLSYSSFTLNVFGTR